MRGAIGEVALTIFVPYRPAKLNELFGELSDSDDDAEDDLDDPESSRDALPLKEAPQ